MLKTKKGKSILVCRWGRKRSRGHLLRVNRDVHLITNAIADSDRRRWVSAVIVQAWERKLFTPKLKVEKSKCQ